MIKLLCFFGNMITFFTGIFGEYDHIFHWNYDDIKVVNFYDEDEYEEEEEEEDNDEDNENEYEDEDEEEEDNNENEYLRAAARVVATTPVAQAACSPLLSKAITWQETP